MPWRGWLPTCGAMLPSGDQMMCWVNVDLTIEDLMTCMACGAPVILDEHAKTWKCTKCKTSGTFSDRKTP